MVRMGSAVRVRKSAPVIARVSEVEGSPCFFSVCPMLSEVVSFALTKRVGSIKPLPTTKTRFMRDEKPVIMGYLGIAKG